MIKGKAVAAVGGLVAVMVLGGPSTGVAMDWAPYCGHQTTYSQGHRSISYYGYVNSGGRHYHQYKHDVAWAPDHHPWKVC